MPSEAKELVCCLTTIIEAATDFVSEALGFETDIRCNQTDCQGKIHSRPLVEENLDILEVSDFLKQEDYLRMGRHAMGWELKVKKSLVVNAGC